MFSTSLSDRSSMVSTVNSSFDPEIVSIAETLRMPFESSLNVTSILGIPAGFNSIFFSIDEQVSDDDDDNILYQIPDKSEVYNIGLMNMYLTSLLKKHLDDREFEVLRLSYGLDCDKHSANQIAELLDMEGASAYVRVSELKKQAIKKLVENVEPSQVLDYL